MKSQKIKIIITYALSVILCILVMPPIFTNGIMCDEAFSILLVEGNAMDIIGGTANDVHPPLYYLILKLISLFTGSSLSGFKFTSLIATALNLIVLGGTMIRKRWGCRVAIFYILWFGFCYSTFVYSTQIRMYSWGCFFVTATALFLFKYYEEKKKKDYIFSIIFTLAAMYTHYYAVMAVFVAWMILFIYTVFKERKNFWKIFIAGIVIVVGYLPWLGILLTQSSKVSENYWIKTFSWNDCFFSAMELMDCKYQEISQILFILSIVLIVVAIFRKNKVALCGIAVFAGTIFVCGILSVLVAPIWQARYLYNAWGVFCIALAIVIGERRDNKLIIPQGLLMLLLMIAGVFSTHTLWHSDLVVNTSADWINCIEATIEEGDLIIVDDPYDHIVLYEYYIPENKIIMIQDLDLMDGDTSLNAVLKEYQDCNVWYVIDYVLTPFGIELFSKELNEHGYHLESKGFYTIQYKVLDIYLIKETDDETQ